MEMTTNREAVERGFEYADLLWDALPAEIDAQSACVAVAVLYSWVLRKAVDVRGSRAPTQQQLQASLLLADACFKDIRNMLALGGPDAPKEKHHGRA